MEINEILNLIEFSISRYKDEEYQVGFSLLDYYSITDIEPRDLAKIAQNSHRGSLAVGLREFNVKYSHLFTKVDLKRRMDCLYSLRGREMTKLDKVVLHQILIDRGYPVINGVYDAACRYYASNNLENLNKEDIQNKIKKAYCKAKGIDFEIEPTTTKPLVKSLIE